MSRGKRYGYHLTGDMSVKIDFSFVFDTVIKIQQVGQGAYGDVWLGCEVHTGQWVALKRMKSQQQQQQPNQQQLDPHHHAAAAQQQMLMWHLQNNTEDRDGFPKTAIREISLLSELKGK